jgi:hypothetical protein
MLSKITLALVLHHHCHHCPTGFCWKLPLRGPAFRLLKLEWADRLLAMSAMTMSIPAKALPDDHS